MSTAGQRGPITHGAFLTSADTTNGLSGAPVLDSQGRLVGVNVTVAGGIDPQERFGSRAVGVSVKAARTALAITLANNRDARDSATVVLIPACRRAEWDKLDTR